MYPLLILCCSSLALLSTPALAAVESSSSYTGTFIGITCIAIFLISYLFVLGEEFFHLRKSKPMIIAAGLIWLLVGLAFSLDGDTVSAAQAFRHNLLDYAELFFFLLAAMSFITTLEERLVFAALRAWLIARQLTLIQIYWTTGLMAFFLSPIADNLSTALLMGAVVMAVGHNNVKFVTVGCINVVVAANAGGAFSPFGDITTLMVWQKGMISFSGFFSLFIPSLINWLVPACLMCLTVERIKPLPDRRGQKRQMKPGAVPILILFLSTILLAISSHALLHMPPVLGMMTGLGVLKLYGYYLSQFEAGIRDTGHIHNHHSENLTDISKMKGDHTDVIRRFDIFKVVERSSWDTLMFFYGIVMAVGGLATLGYLTLLSDLVYNNLGPTLSNSLIGLLSALIDNIPVMFAVLTMQPDMSGNQWLLITLTAGVGGSLLSIGSAAGIALMGQAQGVYTFYSHLKWSWAIGLGYILSIAAHLWINGS
ncbi:sodium:proton antiporter NhaD [Amphritea japonica]|uniref:Na+:H+ antiporter, NhaD family n=1 Tax=Amphritea japonica ATCC BAA-1530 TaxID=1278309 RepID=A0A7R6SU83_9GAMM|nr:sodium:proton antiporter NhaD [Amphritea japonica]BBB27422.1 Na+:H+ antiporter, NhaD family [Amphritea japonica ATCC BAA-1530]